MHELHTVQTLAALESLKAEVGALSREHARLRGDAETLAVMAKSDIEAVTASIVAALLLPESDAQTSAADAELPLPRQLGSRIGADVVLLARAELPDFLLDAAAATAVWRGTTLSCAALLPPGTPQVAVYPAVETSIRSALTGRAVGVVVFGGPAAGKSFALHGVVGQRGLVFRALQDLVWAGDELELEGFQLSLALRIGSSPPTPVASATEAVYTLDAAPASIVTVDVVVHATAGAPDPDAEPRHGSVRFVELSHELLADPVSAAERLEEEAAAHDVTTVLAVVSPDADVAAATLAALTQT
ncbi:uncharacterized protein AMSG_04111 [Thecamonas trahens ATCC 50062]|uniref:Kinesin motor domain-containing protein n=1 Tax=Thecamonas trahens ATCC 50062 TaxID=461836 RepID=A0A0L0D701_THETB|nr:hypothetical protein AMSG_04111 [Thecamonas trahens ATCC 50062]KNC47881.1 hypothetical protein AMSG_04111 [Thecamonas trahens ATCC 50062]|eukprot:XP_013759359.1 hypothetical protein AMSG_04111 [Thecamonas trahens ATCC 50062]